MKNILHLLTITTLSGSISNWINHAINWANHISHSIFDKKSIDYNISHTNGIKIIANAWSDYYDTKIQKVTSVFFNYGEYGFKNINDFIKSDYNFEISNWKLISDIGWPHYSLDHKTNDTFSKYNDTDTITKYLNHNIKMTDANDFDAYGDTQATISMELSDDSSTHQITATYTSLLHNTNNFENISNQLFV